MSRRRGNENENAFCAIAEALGYATFCARGSRGPVDVLCWHREDRDRPAVVVQVGTAAKPIERTLTELLCAPRRIRAAEIKGFVAPA